MNALYIGLFVFDKILWLDFETRSRVNLKKHGEYLYTDQCEIIIWAYAIDRGMPKTVDWLSDGRKPLPDELIDVLEDETYIIVTHSHFDRLVLWSNGYGWIRQERFWDTAALGRSCGLVGELALLCKVLDFPDDYKKKEYGMTGINLFCIPDKKTGSFRSLWECPEDWLKFIEYAAYDIHSMRHVFDVLPHHNWIHDRVAWLAYEQMNDRGLYVDRILATNAISLVAKVKDENNDRASEIMDERVKLTQTAAILEYVKGRGVEIEDLKSASIDAILKNVSDLPPEVAEMLSLRSITAKNATAKYVRVLNFASDDGWGNGYLRGSMMFDGAVRTGRNTGRAFQPLNLPRPSIKGVELSEAIGNIRKGVTP